jgi:hypothetical protein
MNRLRQPTATFGINHSAVDRFTLAHGALGAAFGFVRAPVWATLVWALGWEIIERPLKDRWPHLFPHATQDTAINSIVDAAAGMAGWWAGEKLRDRWDER